MNYKKIFAAVFTTGIMLSFIPAYTNADSNTGWHKEGDYWKYYTYEKGYITYDWKQIGGKWYYFAKNGLMVSGVNNYLINDKFYDFASSGECLNPTGRSTGKPGWCRSPELVINADENGLSPQYKYDWVYFDDDGKLTTGWKKIAGSWYYFNQIGIMSYCSEGYYPRDINGTPYWFKETGEMITGWYYDGKAWHYAKPDGEVLQDTWYKIGGKWYYFDARSYMYKNSENVLIGDKYYSFDSTGACINPEGRSKLGPGWVRHNYDMFGGTCWSYWDENSQYYTGWHKIDNKWYCFSKIGYLYCGILYDNNKQYYMGKDGAMKTGWQKVSWDNTTYNWIYAGSDGVLYKDRWLCDNGKWYYIRGYMVRNVVNYEIDGVYYNFDSNGVCTNPYSGVTKLSGWIRRTDQDGDLSWFYYSPDGTMYKNKWLNSAGKWYYFSSDGSMVLGSQYLTNTWRIDGKFYDFDSDGVCLNHDHPR